MCVCWTYAGSLFSPSCVPGSCGDCRRPAPTAHLFSDAHFFCSNSVACPRISFLVSFVFPLSLFGSFFALPLGCVLCSLFPFVTTDPLLFHVCVCACVCVYSSVHPLPRLHYSISHFLFSISAPFFCLSAVFHLLASNCPPPDLLLLAALPSPPLVLLFDLLRSLRLSHLFFLFSFLWASCGALSVS